MDERDELQQKIADIAGRYIQRTAGELAGLREMIGKARAGSAAAGSVQKSSIGSAHMVLPRYAVVFFEANPVPRYQMQAPICALKARTCDTSSVV